MRASGISSRANSAIRSTSSRWIIVEPSGEEPPQHLLDPAAEAHGELEVPAVAVDVHHHAAPELFVKHHAPERAVRARGGRERRRGTALGPGARGEAAAPA